MVTIIDVQKIAIEVVNVISANGAHFSVADQILEQAKQYIGAQKVASVPVESVSKEPAR